MRLSWNEIKARAAVFADEWQNASYEKGETQSFYNDFFEVFGVKRRRVASFEEPVKLLGKRRGFIDLFWKGVLLIEHKSAGHSLVPAKTQALDYFPGLKESELPRYVLLSDFQGFELYDLDEGTERSFKLADLPKNVEAFGFIIGVQHRTFRDQDPVNIEASELMGKLHDALKASGYVGHELERFLVRIVFCLFADATGIFEPRGIFDALLSERTSEDGSDTGAWLSQLFDVLMKPEARRQATLDEDLKQFPYINGDLFTERLAIPAFDKEMRKKLLEACSFSWDAISPAIFGALFQSVMNKRERRAQGAHYTTERNILKVIEPLFLDALKADFERLLARRDTGRAAALRAFQHRLAGLRFLDPACGCGNFLIIAYRELRVIELEVIKALNPKGQRTLDVATLSKIDVAQFYGIELTEFPARIAEVALWMMDHIMNVQLSLEFGQVYARIPLVAAPHIRHGDALEVDWATVLKPAECSYVFGNPPFIGAKYQKDAQRQRVRQIAKLGGSGGTLDYVAAWFLKAGAYVGEGKALIAFVSTNSITQGEQVAQLWPLLFGRYKLEIAFAHRTFAWGSDARGVAHVHVVVIGLARRDQEPREKRLFSYDDVKADPVESGHEALTAYLFDAGKVLDRHLVVTEQGRPLWAVPRLVTGTQPIDDGNYIFDAAERKEFLRKEPGAAEYLHPFLGGSEYINGVKRWLLYLNGVRPNVLRQMPEVLDRMRKVKAFRKKSERKSTLAIADTPEKLNVELEPSSPFLAIPEVSSERRDYIPIGWLEPPTIPSNKLRVIQNAGLWHFGILTSRMHMAWTRFVGGRLKSDYQYSVGINYNAFPWPDVDDNKKRQIEKLAQAVLDARALYPSSTLADLYDNEVTPIELRRAHRGLDKAVDKLYAGATLDSDRERVEHLFGLYEKRIAPLTTLATGPKKKPRQSRSRTN